MTKKLGSRLRKQGAAKQRYAEWRDALEMIESQPHLRAIWANDGTFFLHPLLSMGFLLNPNPYGKEELERDDRIAHDEMCARSRVQMGTNTPLGVVVCTLQQTKVLAFLFRHFAETIPLREKEKELRKARKLGVYQSTLVPMKRCADGLEDFQEEIEEPLLAIATALDGLVAEGKSAFFWFDKRLFPEIERKVREESLEGSSLARFLFSTSDQDWAQMLENSGHSKRKIEKALDSKRQSYQKFIERRKKRG